MLTRSGKPETPGLPLRPYRRRPMTSNNGDSLHTKSQTKRGAGSPRPGGTPSSSGPRKLGSLSRGKSSNGASKKSRRQ
eukprot:16435400-Heterocapsa_arctica.AAC.1